MGDQTAPTAAEVEKAARGYESGLYALREPDRIAGWSKSAATNIARHVLANHPDLFAKDMREDGRG